jgi:hypothetical protein
MGIAIVILTSASVYALLGVLVGGMFVVTGVSTVDHAAAGKGAPWSFRILILPGAIALWPVVLLKWLRAARRASEHNP